MRLNCRSRLLVLALAGVSTVGLAVPAFARSQAPGAARPAAVAGSNADQDARGRVTGRRGGDNQPLYTATDVDTRRADDVRRDLRAVLDRYPPDLGRVLKLDPTLMSSDAYLKPYPALEAFLQQHPDVVRDPAFFLDFVDINQGYHDEPYNPQRAGMQMGEEVLAGTAVLLGFLMGVLTLTWIIRYIVTHRRWLRATKLQSEIHTRLLERFSSNEDLMAYMQSPGGSRFLQPLMPDAMNPGAPFSRILWSAQAGVVLLSGGIGLLVIRAQMIEPLTQVALIAGVLLLSIGVGFVLASGASYVMSRRLGLLNEAHRSGV